MNLPVQNGVDPCLKDEKKKPGILTQFSFSREFAKVSFFLPSKRDAHFLSRETAAFIFNVQLLCLQC